MLSDHRKTIHLLPFICDAGAQMRGTQDGPVESQKRGLQQHLEALGYDSSWPIDPQLLHDQYAQKYKSLPVIGSVERREIVLQACRDMAAQVERSMQTDALPVTLGGDHAMAMGSIAGFARATKGHGRIGVIWVDAHADLHTPDTTPSQALHGMPLPALMGLGDPEFCEVVGGRPVLNPQHLAYIGLRSTEPEEETRIRDMGIHAFRMTDVERIGVQGVFDRAFELISPQVDYLVLSIDLDAFDPRFTPAVGSPEPDGLDPRPVAEALRTIAQKHPFGMIEIAEFNPTLPGADETYDVLLATLKAALGEP
jgi:arginase